jgi:obg-like ATPase 1
MPPKKKEEEVKKVILGRASNTLRMGLVGLPNVGKSTTFNVLSNLNVPAENFPFCTIDPNLAKTYVPDKRFDKLLEMYKPKSEVGATITVTDIAGLVKGASEGAGLGNAFLSHIAAVDGIYHVVRAFDNPEIIHEEGDVDPPRDMDIIHGELVAKDVQYLKTKIEDLDKVIKRTNAKPARDEMEVLLRVDALLKELKNVRDADWSAKDIEFLNQHNFITSKPVVYLVNISEDEYIKKKNKHLPKIQKWINEHGGGPMIPFSAEFEKKVTSEGPDPEVRRKIADELGAPSCISKIIKTGYTTLRLIHYFTAGEDEVKCWTIREGTKAPQAAGVIHTDFERGFICAEVMKFEDLERLGSEQNVKAEGLYRQQGKDYEVIDGDIIYFKFNVTAQPKKIAK